MKKEIEKININQLKPAEYNPRVINPSEMEKLKKGLKTHGLIDPIIIDLTDDYTVIGGHQRLAALQELYPDKDIELGLIRFGDIGFVIKETDLKVADKNDQKAKNLSLNKIQGDWDYNKLDELLLELQEQHYDLELTGFDADELLLEGIDLSDFEDTFDDTVELEPPTDLNDEAQGTIENKNYVVLLSFETKDEADEYIKYSLDCDKSIKPNTTSIVLYAGKDFCKPVIEADYADSE